jgi:hypothetical protein
MRGRRQTAKPLPPEHAKPELFRCSEYARGVNGFPGDRRLHSSQEPRLRRGSPAPASPGEAGGVQGLNQRTVSNYKDILEHWAARIGGETQVPSITSQDLKRYLVWKTTEYVPVRKNGKTHPLSPKTTRNIYVTFQAFFRWIGEEFDFSNPMKGIPVSKFVSPHR